MNPLQFLAEGIKFAVHAIRGNKLRSFLTMLGVATGIFAITSILTMVNSMQSSITENLSALGNTTLFVHNWPWTDSGEDWFKYWNRPKVSYKDYQKLKQNLNGVEGVGYQVTVGGRTAKYKAQDIGGIEIVGTTPDMEVIFGFDFEEGRSFAGIEYQLGSYTCIIAADVKEGLFPDQSAIGKKIRVGGKQLTIIGVLKKVGVPIGPRDDDNIYVPYKTASRMYNLNRRWIDKVVAIKVSNYEDMGYVENETIGVMRASRGLKPRMEDNFSINKQESLMNEINKVFGYLELGGIVISIFSVLIGGFSIGNIMYISVRERTNEIGIQKALGSNQAFILYQFLTEAIIICLLGGLLGLVGVYGLTALVQVIINSADLPLKVFVSAQDVTLAMGLSGGIGLISGFIPAFLAAIVDPVVAIRHS